MCCRPPPLLLDWDVHGMCMQASAHPGAHPPLRGHQSRAVLVFILLLWGIGAQTPNPRGQQQHTYLARQLGLLRRHGAQRLHPGVIRPTSVRQLILYATGVPPSAVCEDEYRGVAQHKQAWLATSRSSRGSRHHRPAGAAQRLIATTGPSAARPPWLCCHSSACRPLARGRAAGP